MLFAFSFVHGIICALCFFMFLSYFQHTQITKHVYEVVWLNGAFAHYEHMLHLTQGFQSTTPGIVYFIILFVCKTLQLYNCICIYLFFWLFESFFYLSLPVKRIGWKGTFALNEQMLRLQTMLFRVTQIVIHFLS